MRNVTVAKLASHKWSVLSMTLSIAGYLAVYMVISGLASLNLWVPESLAAKRLASVQMVVALAAIAMGGVAFKGERPKSWGATALVLGFLCFASAAI